MPRPCVRAIHPVTATAIAIVLAACGASTPSPVATPSPLPSPTPVATPTATAIASPEATRVPDPTPDATEAAAQSADPNTFVSPVYQYALTLPPGSLLRNWGPAERAWDFRSKLESGGPFLDDAAIKEGGIYLYGAPSASLEEWFGVVEGAGIRFHRCTKAQNRQDATIGDAKAIAFTQSCSNNIERWARVAIFKDGYGVALWLHPTPGAEVAGRDRALEVLKGLQWRSG
jgi:hypothetical protein